MSLRSILSFVRMFVPAAVSPAGVVRLRAASRGLRICCSSPHTPLQRCAIQALQVLPAGSQPPRTSMLRTYCIASTENSSTQALAATAASPSVPNPQRAEADAAAVATDGVPTTAGSAASPTRADATASPSTHNAWRLFLLALFDRGYFEGMPESLK